MRQVLNNPLLPPTTELLQTILCDNYKNLAHLENVFSKYGIVSEWNYYKDGKNWLCKVQYKKKTALWLSVWEDCFKLSFFFTEKTRMGIDDLDISPTIKRVFKEQKAIGKLIPLILEIRDSSTLPDAERILEYKINCK